MEQVKFRQLPMWVRVVIGLALINVWVSLEGFVIEPTGLWKYMPYYKVGGFCVWDFSAIMLVTAGLWWASVRDEHVASKRTGSA
jgi:hypothetical protein